MKHLFASLLLLSPAVLSAQPPKPADPVKELVDDLREARGLLRKTDRASRDRLELLITRAELKALELQKKVAAPVVRTPVADANFADMLAGIRKNAFDSGKLAFVTEVAKANWFTCHQAKQLLKEFTFDTDRVKAALLLHPRLADPQNFFSVLDVFTFESGREAVRKALGEKK